MEKTNFIKNEIFILTVLGAFGRNGVYGNSATETDKLQFRNDIKALLVELEDKYKNKVTEEEHLLILGRLKSDIENKGKKTLKKSSISFGTVQKLLNLYLKYLWCLGFTAEPPNCPIDRIILNTIKDYKTSWTKMDKKEYITAINKIRAVKGIKSIAEWELNEFKRR